MAGIWECGKYAKKYGVNLIPGNEFYVVPDVTTQYGVIKKGDAAHLCLLAIDNKGYENLLQLTARSNLEGYYYEPHIDHSMLREHSEGLVCLSGCLGGYVSKAIKNGRSPRLAVDFLHSIFGDRLFLEIQALQIPEQKVLNDHLIRISKETNIPLVATVDAHYLDKKDSFIQDVLFAMQMKRQLNELDRHKLEPEEHSVETPDEVYNRFVKNYGAIGKQACENTILISENSKVQVEWSSKNYKVPSLDIAAQPDWSEFLKWKSGCECHSVNGLCLVHGHECSPDCEH